MTRKAKPAVPPTRAPLSEADMRLLAWAKRAIRDVTDAELALLALIAIDRDDKNTAALLDAYEAEAARRGMQL
jgi:hypothetical protein